MSTPFDPSRAWLKGPDFFPRFVVPDQAPLLSDAKLDADTELILAERNGARRAFIARELSHPHMAQGTLGGEPYLLSF